MIEFGKPLAAYKKTDGGPTNGVRFAGDEQANLETGVSLLVGRLLQVGRQRLGQIENDRSMQQVGRFQDLDLAANQLGPLEVEIVEIVADAEFGKIPQRS
jgi:hypothetical protein